MSMKRRRVGELIHIALLWALTLYLLLKAMRT